ncbi:hypothetical protein FACS1894186_1260 [Alphaproteobacteria bacterium]|nr:hypothetical protein FACS1894186_1260 [Alphaproteobacteria bacterium]
MISSKEISVIVQGAVDKTTPRCLKSVRRHLPDAEIILSTWEGADTAGLSYDRVIFNSDPGGIKYDPYNTNNINRQLLSTQSGLAKAARPYVLKLRSDLALSGCGFLRQFDKYPAYDEKYRLFSCRLLTNLLFSIKFEEAAKGKRHWLPFHVSDWWYFGRREDILKLFDVPLVAEPGYTRYFETHDKPKYKVEVFPLRLWRMSPEQYLLSSLVKKQFPSTRFEHMLDYDSDNIEMSARIVVNNYQILSPQKSGIRILKRKYGGARYRNMLDGTCRDGLYHELVWLADYQRFCDASFVMPHHWPQKLECEREYAKAKEHLGKLTINFERFHSQVIPTVIYSLRMFYAIARHYVHIARRHLSPSFGVNQPRQ